jgi:pantoate--beta-alanine ligase
MLIAESIPALKSARAGFMGSVGFVPTMGALHAGHLSLVGASKAENDYTVVSIFVNPAQFGPNEDLSAYPRDLPGDLALLRQAGVDLVFTPDEAMIYPPGFQTYVTVEQVSQGLEGARRPGHFRGVATVVTKLFNVVRPRVAYFGQKDAQQVAVIRRMTHDLDSPVEIAVCPTMRAPDGLALSSRNAYLTPGQRQAASVLKHSLDAAGQAYVNGERDPDRLRAVVRAVLEAEPLAAVDYVSLADARTLQELHQPTGAPALLSIAAQIGRPRLLDNCLLPLSLNTRQGLAVLGAPG